MEHGPAPRVLPLRGGRGVRRAGLQRRRPTEVRVGCLEHDGGGAREVGPRPEPLPRDHRDEVRGGARGRELEKGRPGAPRRVPPGQDLQSALQVHRDPARGRARPRVDGQRRLRGQEVAGERAPRRAVRGHILFLARHVLRWLLGAVRHGGRDPLLRQARGRGGMPQDRGPGEAGRCPSLQGGFRGGRVEGGGRGPGQAGLQGGRRVSLRPDAGAQTRPHKRRGHGRAGEHNGRRLPGEREGGPG